MSTRKQELLDAQYLATHLGISPDVVQQESDPPDVLWRINEILVGLEITSGDSQESRRLEALSKKERLPFLRNVSDFRDDSQHPERRSNEQLAEAAQSLGGCDLVVSTRHWLERIASRIQRKLLNLNNPEYPRHDENWLLVFDREVWFSYEIEDYCRWLFHFVPPFHEGVAFDRIYVVGDPFIFCLRDGSWTGNLFRI